MILNAQPKQLRLLDDGQIVWQHDASNPLPGVLVARVEKGATQMSPQVVLLDTDVLKDQDRDAVRDFIQAWLSAHIAAVLEVLGNMTLEEGIAGPARDIAHRVADALGIVPRQDLEDLIAGLDVDARRVLRQRHVRLGPVLVFVPELNKPAAVRLRALLWSLWHDRPLPAPVPKDGAVSVAVDEAQSDPVYYRAIGYPLYGGRAIRIDMLDRVISAVYDSAKNGSFKATHTMAEWLGCSIADLYRVLEAMGHTKTHDPAEAPPIKAEPAAEEAKPIVETGKEEPASQDTVAVAAPPSPPPKPELATFRLRRGKTDNRSAPARKPHQDNPKSDSNGPRRDKREKSADRPRKKAGGKPAREEKRPMRFEARPQQDEDSPFAVLQQLKSGMKDQ